MVELTCGERRILLEPNESVLAGLERAGMAMQSSCRAGACQSCLVQLTRGSLPPRAQQGLKDSLRERGFVLSCQAFPTEDCEVVVGAARALERAALVESTQRLAEDVVSVRLRTEGELAHRAGQFVNLVRKDGLARAYSIASRPADGPSLELHVRVLVGGKMSNWLASEAAVGAELSIRGPAGECFYTEGRPEQPLVLAGTGTGLAPLWGILRDALAAGHHGRIELWHGARHPSGLYLQNELEALQAKHENFRYRPCALSGSVGTVSIGRLDDLLLAAAPSFATTRFFLCGDAPLVQGLKRTLFLRGAALQNIHADAFVGSAT